MLSKSFQRGFYAAFILKIASAQSEVIPSDLSGGFSGNEVDLQVSFTGEAVNGFQDGTQFEKSGASRLGQALGCSLIVS